MSVPRKLSFKITTTGCFEIISHRCNSWGYGQIKFDGIAGRAHRYIWEECFGPIPNGLCVCHHCDNPACINPEHLFLGTQIDNIKDKVQKGRQARGRELGVKLQGSLSGQAKLTEEKVVAIKKALTNKISQVELGKIYKVHQTMIHYIACGLTWRHVGDNLNEKTAH